MTAEFTPDGGSLITLAGADSSGWFDQPTGVQMGQDLAVQAADIVRGTKPKRYGRGNATRSVSFKVSKSYDTWDLAVAGNASLIAALTDIGTFVLKNAAGSTILTINQAKVTVTATDEGAVAVRNFSVEGTA